MSPGTPATTRAYKQRVADALDELFNRGNLNATEDLVHADFFNHEASAARPRGPEGLRQTVSWIRAAFSDLRFAIEDMIAEDDKVVVRLTMSGRHTGELMGIAPTGRDFSVQHIHIFRLVDGKLIEHWANRDDLGQMAQLGLMPALHNPR